MEYGAVNQNSKKRLCLTKCKCSPENPRPSNIVRIAKALFPFSDNGVEQLIFYDSGIGTAGLVDRLVGGAFGTGIDINIQQLYTCLSLYYEEGDEIYMFGYSRGAYTVRSLGGLIHECGLVRKDYVERVNDAYELYRSDKGVDHPDCINFRKKYGERVQIKLLACFETVGALGIPDNMGLLHGLNRNRYEFHNTNLSDLIENAVHLLSIDEDNYLLRPTYMEGYKDKPNQLSQVYFWGRHGGVGGSEEQQIECGNISLRFLVNEMKQRRLGLQFNMSLIPENTDPLVENDFGGGTIFSVIRYVFGTYYRKINDIDVVNDSAIQRYRGVRTWRPQALESLSDLILDS